MFQTVSNVGDLADVVTQVTENRACGFRRVPVQIYERFERALVAGLTGVLPVDRTIRIHLHMVVIEIVHEVLADALA